MFDTTANNRFSLTMVLAFILVVAAGFFANPLSAQPPPGSTVCFECDVGCQDKGGGELCFSAGPGRLGGIQCTVNGGPLPGSDICHCWAFGGICEGAPEDDAPQLAERALDAVKWGNMLPADGPFFVATRGDELIVRRKCGGEAIGRVVVSANRGRSILPAVG